MIPRRISKPLTIGDVPVGGGRPVVVQSMTNTDTRDALATVKQIHALEEAGCEIVRVAVPDMAAAEALPRIKSQIHIPLVADIHFDYRLALAALAAGVDGLRLNPGNIRERDKVAAVVRSARERQVPIRIGVNAGSLPPLPPLAPGEHPPPTPQRMVDVALEQARFLEALDFHLIKISLKAFDVPTTVEAYRLIAPLVPYPLHLGITEAGTVRAGSIRSAVGLGILLYEGIGDTIRVSLTGDPVPEVETAYHILSSLGLRQRGPVLVSCPTCGRCETDLVSLAQAVEERLVRLGKPLKVAVMGCVVNGPGEAREADLGLAAGKGRGVIFKKGQVLRTVEEKDFLSALLTEIDGL
ncbi:MAG: flavodoxin-dependent (E)-4-hydroxy-3-methylbut-2-enyl-diphosphate synthase [Chloroflexi bacterium]|nr:flavodoxin-dependent (E)-4-hydroxy-3-methylbut-2-enyl-diphosphate synthase [Chloroflexota bacterium]